MTPIRGLGEHGPKAPRLRARGRVEKVTFLARFSISSQYWFTCSSVVSHSGSVFGVDHGTCLRCVQPVVYT
jgi:hypothetical protein